MIWLEVYIIPSNTKYEKSSTRSKVQFQFSTSLWKCTSSFPPHIVKGGPSIHPRDRQKVVLVFVHLEGWLQLSFPWSKGSTSFHPFVKGQLQISSSRQRIALDFIFPSKDSFKFRPLHQMISLDFILNGKAPRQRIVYIFSLLVRRQLLLFTLFVKGQLQFSSSSSMDSFCFSPSSSKDSFRFHTPVKGQLQIPSSRQRIALDFILPSKDSFRFHPPVKGCLQISSSRQRIALDFVLFIKGYLQISSSSAKLLVKEQLIFSHSSSKDSFCFHPLRWKIASVFILVEQF